MCIPHPSPHVVYVRAGGRKYRQGVVKALYAHTSASAVIGTVRDARGAVKTRGKGVVVPTDRAGTKPSVGAES